jgi:hypothetical protein
MFIFMNMDDNFIHQHQSNIVEILSIYDSHRFFIDWSSDHVQIIFRDNETENKDDYDDDFSQIILYVTEYIHIYGFELFSVVFNDETMEILFKNYVNDTHFHELEINKKIGLFSKVKWVQFLNNSVRIGYENKQQKFNKETRKHFRSYFYDYCLFQFTRIKNFFNKDGRIQNENIFR